MTNASRPGAFRAYRSQPGPQAPAAPPAAPGGRDPSALRWTPSAAGRLRQASVFRSHDSCGEEGARRPGGGRSPPRGAPGPVVQATGLSDRFLPARKFNIHGLLTGGRPPFGPSPWRPRRRAPPTFRLLRPPVITGLMEKGAKVAAGIAVLAVLVASSASRSGPPTGSGRRGPAPRPTAGSPPARRAPRPARGVC